jgi:hypothetical protein
MFNAVAALSILLCVTVTVLWMESRWRYEVISWSSRYDDGHQKILEVRNGAGCFYLVLDRRGVSPGESSGFFEDPGFAFVHSGASGRPAANLQSLRSRVHAA